MPGSSSEDDGSDDDDVLASLRGDFADPFQRATARSEADRERDEADEEDERLIGDVAALAEVGDSDDDLDDDALAEEALALAGTRGGTTIPKTRRRRRSRSRRRRISPRDATRGAIERARTRRDRRK